MARIPEHELEQLKQSISLVRLAEAKGIELKRHGKDYLGLCPFHDDREPSLVISQDNNLWHCLGACQTGGSVIDWVMKAEGVSFRHAVEILREDVSLLAAETSPMVKRATVRKLDTDIATSEDEQTTLQQVVDFYHETLKQTPDAIAYLKKRGLAHAEVVDTFKLGFSNRSLGYRLPDKNRKEGAIMRTRLQQAGLYRESGHEHFSGSLVIPIFDENGRVMEMYGRKINDKRLRKGTPMHLYLPGPHRGVFNAEGVRASEEVIVCESLIDALTFWVAGFRNVTASYGAEGWTRDHLALFKESGVKRVLIAYDRDDAGQLATNKLAEKLLAEGFDCFQILFPHNMDANEYALKVQPAAKSLGLAIRKASWLGKGQPPMLTTMPAEVEMTITDVLDDEIEEEEEITVVPAVVEDTAPTLAAEALPVLTDSPMPALPQSSVEANINEREINIVLGDRRYRIRGLEQNHNPVVMRINLFATNESGFHVDTVDFYHIRQRAAFCKQASLELRVKEDVIKRDLGQVLLKLEELQEQQLREAMTGTPQEKFAMSEQERTEALALLRSPNLLEQILTDFERCGVVGETTNKLVGYLGCVSRKLESPLAILIQSSSAAGKSSLMDAVLAFVPEEEREQYSAMTGQSLYYMGDMELKHKILAIAEEEGAERASYALKLLQSEGVITIASTGKDATTGELKTKPYKVEGPVMLFSTTTAIDIDEELMNRCLVLTVDESRAQTKAIHQQQRQAFTLDGLRARVDKKKITQTHRNAQRLLQPLQVLNPYVDNLTFMDDVTRTRRDHKKYLGLINVIALLHQYQRPIKQERYHGENIRYVEVTLSDIAAANKLAAEVLGRTLDELPPQTRRLLGLIAEMVDARCDALQINRCDYQFSRKEVREYTGWGNTQLKVHLNRLSEMEYLLVHKGGRGQSFVYELLYNKEGQQGEPFMMGLMDIQQLQQGYDDKWSGQNDKQSASSRAVVGNQSGGGHSLKNTENSIKDSENTQAQLKPIKTQYTGENNPAASHHKHTQEAALV